MMQMRLNLVLLEHLIFTKFLIKNRRIRKKIFKRFFVIINSNLHNNKFCITFN